MDDFFSIKILLILELKFMYHVENKLEDSTSCSAIVTIRVCATLMLYECTNPFILYNYCPLVADKKHLFQTHHRLLHVHFLTTGQAEVCYFCHTVITYEDISGCQIPVDKLMLRERRNAEEAELCDISTVNRPNSTFDTKMDTLVAIAEFN